ncbi:MAG TPA: flagellar export protein FliJ [Acidimicrobiales bacterium]|nr:flagellar export protein FliJ [Acidimicrobiales bacterium]
MRAFRFRLESVARVRQLQERLAAEQLALATRELRAAQARCDDIRAATKQLTFPEGPSQMAALLWVHDQSARLSDLLRQREAQAAQAEAGADRARGAWLEAERRCRALRRLEERKRERWQLDADRADGAELDDMATVRFGIRDGVR